jgi:LacI family transcriptional regulator
MDKLSQIAEAAGVSTNTVLRVLRGQNKEVWPSAMRRAEQIRQLALDLGYLPNSSARAMRRGRFDCVSLLLSTDIGRSYLPADLLTEIQIALDVSGIRLNVMRLPDEALTNETSVNAMLRDWSSDGLLINYSDHVPTEMIHLLQRFRIPSVWINRKQPSDCVYYDDFGGAAEATRHLQRLGHRRIAYLDFITHEPESITHYSRIDRYAGFCAAMREAGLDPDRFHRERFVGLPADARLEATRQLMTFADAPTAIIAYDAGERVLYAAALAGLRVPEDVSLLTFVPRSSEISRGEQYIGRALAVMRIPTEHAGREAVRLLREKIDCPDTDLSPVVIPLKLSAGDTLAPAKAP